MRLVVTKSGHFTVDFERQFAWYVGQAGEDVARRFQRALDATLTKLSRLPDLGVVRRFRNPRLHGLRSFRVEPPFSKLLVFYSHDSDVLFAWRLLHGSRDLPRRLAEPFGS